ncbi:hypothetical protein PGTUg99_004274 [Puccinia graminis f. sp. tritici]|uniref:histone acetyltransferase n=1 Tax=Puccinia graminis f. sp. tritici TaxID=56615 RepID=A0A5B0S3F5_PUCGR|nr:hypothetical protein PGTUg99_004274 [Puccinia graminis f. sp. tritici]
MLRTNQAHSNNTHPTDQPPSEKRRRTGKDTTSHGPTLEVALVDVDLVVFGRYEINAWFPSPYVIDQIEYRQATLNNHPNPPPPQPNQPTAPHSKRQSNGPFQGKKTKKGNNKHPTQPFQEAPHNTLPTSPSNSSPPHQQQENINHHQDRKRDRSPSPDSLSSLESTSSVPSNHSDLHPTHPLLPVPPKHLYPTPQSHPSSLTSDTGPIKPTPTSNHLPQPDPPPALKLYVCDGCLRYLFSSEAYLQHKMRCNVTHPPGRKVYQSGNLIIREVDGSRAKLYCQCLCLFGKLFIDHKYIFFDVEGFNFYVLTSAESDQRTGGIRETILGFFSKEKVSYDGYNLACIVTLPPYQKKGYGTLLIEFSYELDRFEADKEIGSFRDDSRKLILGTPERPLSTLGARGYLSFWTAVLVRFFRTLFTPPPPRLGAELDKQLGTNKKIPRTTKMMATPEKTIEISLEEISRSTRLRSDDVAFALISSGLAKPKHSTAISSSSDSEPSHEPDRFPESFLITPELVELVARRVNVKSAILDPRHVLLNQADPHHLHDLDPHLPLHNGLLPLDHPPHPSSSPPPHPSDSDSALHPSTPVCHPLPIFLRSSKNSAFSNCAPSRKSSAS